MLMRRSSSRSSLFSADRSQRPTIDPAQICKQTESLLADAARVLSHEQFAPLSFKLLRGLIRRAQTENAHSQAIFLNTISSCVERYGSNLELSVRALLLEVLCQLNSHLLEDIGGKLQKVKHTIIHTSLEYLLSKAFLLEHRYLLASGDEAAALVSLRRCIELNQTHLVEYLQDSAEVRQEIVDHVILAHYQHFRLRRTKKPTAALQSLGRALGAARKSYGSQHSVVRGLEGLYSQQQHLLNNVERGSIKSRAITEIVEMQAGKKHMKASAFYSWQDEKIIAQLLRVRQGERQVLQQATYQIKLDNSKIKLLRGGQWLFVQGNRVSICQDQLLRLLGVGPASQPATKEMTTRIEMRNLSRDLVIRKEELSSSEDSEGVLNREEFKFLKHGRTQSSRKYKE